MKDLRSRLGRFAKAFHCSIAEVKPKDVELWIESLKPTGKESSKLGQRTRVNFLGAVSNLITFSERRRYIGKGSVDLSTIERGKSVGDVEIYTPEELRAILSNARAEIIPFIVIGAFAGVRTQEILRLEWGDVSETHITIRAANAKTRSRRIVPLLPNLAAWLAPYRKTEGKVCELLKPSTSLSAASEKSGIKWRPNALRHSFGSYRLAMVKSESQVSLEMGNTPTMVFRHYRALVTEEKAKEWFQIEPLEPV